MARHGQKQASDETKTEEPETLPGGAPGMPEAPSVETNVAPSTFGRPEVRPREYMVVDGPRSTDGKIRFNSDGYLTFLLPGRHVSEATHNLAKMRAQGIRLELIPDVVEEPAPEAPTLGA